MTTNNEKLGVTVTIDDDHSAEDMIPAIEAAGLIECESLNIVNTVLGKVALAADFDQTLETVRQVPGVLSAEKEMKFGIYEPDNNL
ncbi:MAG TPA: hypothetical protein VFM68_00710 [Candidatus Saccharimonadales bacterium]|nr:hypothetical protein [Candidatus Saccharimonadales bacterium]